MAKPERIPAHVAIIMDGNGRWARLRNKPRTFGHEAGVRAVREVVKAASEVGIKYLTLYTFSVENWSRPRSEVSALMSLLTRTTRKELNDLIKNDVKLRTIGRINGLPATRQKVLQNAVEKTRNNKGLVLTLALNYGGRTEILDAVKAISNSVRAGILDIPDITGLTALIPPGELEGGDGLNLDYNALTVPTGYPDETSALQVFLSQYDLNWHTLQGFEQIIGTAGGTLTSLDGRTSITVPTNALINYAIFTFTPLPDPSYSPGALGDAHNSFQLTAEGLDGEPVTTFIQPLNVTINYSDTDVLSMVEASLALFYYDTGGLTWQDAVTTCYPGAYTRDPLANTISLPLCHLSDFSVLGLPIRYIYLPLITR